MFLSRFLFFLWVSVYSFNFFIEIGDADSHVRRKRKLSFMRHIERFVKENDARKLMCFVEMAKRM